MEKRSKTLATLALILGILSTTSPARADFSDYASGCMMAMGGSLAGTALVGTSLKGESINTTGYAISGLLGCVAGMAYVGFGGARAEFRTRTKLQSENLALEAELNRLSSELCYRRDGGCTPGGKAIIIESEPRVEKNGDKVNETRTWQIQESE